MSRGFVSCRRRGTSLFGGVSKIVWRGKGNTFAMFADHALHFAWHGQHFGRVQLNFSWQAQHFRCVVLRVFCELHWQGCEHSTLHTVHSTLYTPHFTLHTLRSTLHTPHCTLYIPHFTVLFTLETVQFTLEIQHFALKRITLATRNVFGHLCVGSFRVVET